MYYRYIIYIHIYNYNLVKLILSVIFIIFSLNFLFLNDIFLSPSFHTQQASHIRLLHLAISSNSNSMHSKKLILKCCYSLTRANFSF